jgi:hypothetical protein
VSAKGKPTASERRRRNAKGGARTKLWFIVYRDRMRTGLEHCRVCFRHDRLTWEHITNHDDGGTWKFDNVTILCEEHNQERNRRKLAGLALRPLLSLAAEEAEAPPARRPYAIARAASGCGPNAKMPGWKAPVPENEALSSPVRPDQTAAG